MTTKHARPTPLHVLLELVRSEGQDTVILAAIAALRKDMTRRLERIEKEIEVLIAGSLDQQTIDRLVAQLKAANDQLTSDVHSSTP